MPNSSSSRQSARPLARALFLGAAPLVVAASALSAQATVGVRPDTLAPDSLARRADSLASSAAERPQRLAPQRISGARLTTGTAGTLAARVDVVALHRTPAGPSAAATALARLPGVGLSDDQGTRAQPSLDLRGFELSPVVGVPQGVSVFLDGVRINEADAQEVAFDLIPFEAVDSARVIRGPGALFGKNALGGAVLLTTARGEPGESRLEASASEAGFGYRGAHVLASGAADGWDAFALARASDESGFRYDTPARTRLAFANIGHRTDASDVALTLMAADDRISQAGSLPESWLRVDPRLNFTGGDFVAPRLAHAALRGEWRLPGATVRANAYARGGITEQFNVNVDEPSTRAIVRVGSVGGTAELGWPSPVGTLTVGTELAHHRVRYRVLAETTAAAPDVPDACDPDGTCERAHTSEDDAAAFAQLQAALSRRLTMTLAARADWVRLPFRDDREPANDGTGLYRRVSPRAGLAWTAAPALRLYASAGTGFRAPAALELACADESSPCPLPFSLGDDPPLAPVTVLNTEAGASWTGRRVTVDASAYRADTHDEIVFAASTRTAGYLRNVPRVRRQGVELAGRASLGRGVRAFGSWALVDARYRSSVQLASAIPDEPAVQPGDRLALEPAQRSRLGLGATHLLGAFVLDGELSASSVSSMYLRGDEANAHPPLAGHTTAQARLELVHAHYDASVTVENLLGRSYESFGVYALNPLGDPGGERPAQPRLERFLTPGYPRQITLSLATHW